MSDVVRSERITRRQVALARRKAGDLWVAVTALVAAFLALPLAQSTWHGAEASAVLAIGATAMLAGQRWAIAIVVVAELMLVPTVWPRAFVDGTFPSNVIALVTLAAIVPGIVALRRAAAALVLVSGRARTQRTCRQFQLALGAIGVVLASLPVL